jgi:hypothetical protein
MDASLFKSSAFHPTWDLDVFRAQAIALPAKKAQAGKLWRFLAAFEQPLHPEADAEQRPALADALDDRFHPLRPKSAGRAEMSDTGHDNRRRLGQVGGTRGVKSSAPSAPNALRTEVRLPRGSRRGRSQQPFVLGSTRASRLSFEQAKRRALANALKTASM